MTLTELADHLGIALIIDPNPGAALDALGLRDASPNAQACKRGVLATGINPGIAYDICHELAHLLTGYENEEMTLGAQIALASMLDGEGKRRATPRCCGDDVVHTPAKDGA